MGPRETFSSNKDQGSLVSNCLKVKDQHLGEMHIVCAFSAHSYAGEGLTRLQGSLDENSQRGGVMPAPREYLTEGP